MASQISIFLLLALFGILGCQSSEKGAKQFAEFYEKEIGDSKLGMLKLSDGNKDGKVTYAEFHKTMSAQSESEEPLTEQDIQELFQGMDKNRDGVLTEEDFPDKK